MDAWDWTDGRIEDPDGRMDSDGFGRTDGNPDGREKDRTDGWTGEGQEQPRKEKGGKVKTAPREEKGGEGQEQPGEEKTGQVKSAPRVEKGVGQTKPREEEGGKSVSAVPASWEEKGRRRSKPACKRDGHKGESQARKKGLKATCEKEKQKAKVKGTGAGKGAGKVARKSAGKNRLKVEAGAEIVELVFGLVVGIALVTGFIALQSGLNSMGGTALKIMDNRYAALSVTDMGLEGSEPGGIDAPDDGEEEIIPDDPDSGSGGSGGTGEGGAGDEGELPDVEEEGETGGDEYVDTDW